MMSFLSIGKGKNPRIGGVEHKNATKSASSIIYVLLIPGADRNVITKIYAESSSRFQGHHACPGQPVCRAGYGYREKSKTRGLTRFSKSRYESWIDSVCVQALKVIVSSSERLLSTSTSIP